MIATTYTWLIGRPFRFTAMAVLLMLSGTLAQECRASLDIAYDNPVIGNGVQNYGNGLGLVFTVNTPLTVSYLGAFDNGANANLAGHDGTSGVTVQIYSVTNTAGPAGVAYGPAVTFTTSSDTLAGFQQIRGDAFLPIAPTTLVAGTYEIVAYNDVNANSGAGSWSAPTYNTFGGAVSYSNSIGLNGAYYGSNSSSFPTSGDYNTYAAGTFATPEPSSLVLWGVGGLGVFFVARRRCKS
jgi:hypothetical protein